MKRKIFAVLASITLIVSTAGVSAFAADTGKNSVSGGWSESTGYYIDGVPGTTATYTSGTSVVSSLKVASTFANNTPSPTPDKHTGKRLRSVTSAGDPKYAAYGETLWYYKRHYTTARMELSDGTVKTTSDRQWGENATQATSPYYTPKWNENTEARTYWGS